MSNYISNDLIDKMKNRIIESNDYDMHNYPSDDMNLSDNVLIYFNGNQWRIIKLDLMLTYPILYDMYESNNNKYDITLALCPITLRGCVFKGKFVIETYHKYKMILRESHNDDLIPIDMGYKIDPKYVIEINKRYEIKIMTLRDALIFSSDAQFIKLKKNKKDKLLMGIEYYNNDKDPNGIILENGLIHPKTLVWIIQYKSKSTNNEKISILIGRDVSKNQVSGYNSKKSHILEYVSKYKSKIINKNGYLMPMLWFMAKNIYDKSRIVYIS